MRIPNRQIQWGLCCIDHSVIFLYLSPSRGLWNRDVCPSKTWLAEPIELKLYTHVCNAYKDLKADSIPDSG